MDASLKLHSAWLALETLEQPIRDLRNMAEIADHYVVYEGNENLGPFAVDQVEILANRLSEQYAALIESVAAAERHSPSSDERLSTPYSKRRAPEGVPGDDSSVLEAGDEDPKVALMRRVARLAAIRAALAKETDEGKRAKLLSDEDDCMQELADAPCASDGDFFIKARSLLETQVDELGEPTAEADFGFVAIALSAYLKQRPRAR
jgi:hypothetical protein